MSRIPEKDTAVFSADSRIRAILAVPEFHQFPLLLLELCRVCAAYKGMGRLPQRGWRGQYTTGLKRQLAEAAETLDGILADTVKMLKDAPDQGRSILGDALYESLVGAVEGPTFDGVPLMRRRGRKGRR